MVKSCLGLILVASALFVAPELLAAEGTPVPVDFDREIRPILSENCFACHGPDEAKRKSGLRLDRRDEALKPAKSGEHAIVPGDPAQSALLVRVGSKDDDERMPPPSTGKSLSAHQVDLLRRWIAQGAKWATHWAFVAPVRPATPPVQETSWPRNEIDKFVLARLEKEGLHPSPEADKATLLRRASLDLTGLPPSVEEVDAFLSDSSVDAYEKVVDRLMTWQRFGEQQARYWMDAVRYADTHGYHIDSRRDLWKYRDWVIQAYNQNVPFDKFTTDQLAGDLQPNSTLDQKIASGYVRANMTTGEGGVIEDEYRAKYTFDRVETTGTVFLGMTLLCARCHTHKYDPIQHHEYYGLYAIFNQVADPVMDENKPNPEPVVKVPSKEQAERLRWLEQHIAQTQRQVDAPMPPLDEAQETWQREWNGRLNSGFRCLEPVWAKSSRTNGAQLRLPGDGTIIAEGPNPESDLQEIRFHLEPAWISALRLEVLPNGSTGTNTCGRAADGSFFLSELEADLIRPTVAGKESKPERLKVTRAVADSESKDHEIGRALDGNPDTGWQLSSNAVSEPHAALLVLKEPVEIDAGAELRLRLHYEGGKPAGAVAQFRVSAGSGGEIDRWLHPPQFSNWHLLGPLRAGNPRATLGASFEPEKEVDLKKKYPGIREEAGWSEREDLEDGKANLLVQDLHGIHGVRYLYRTIRVPQPRAVDIDLRADGVFRLWLNDQLVAERDHEEVPGEGPLSVTLSLKEGSNRILLKIITVQGASYFTFNPDLGSPATLPADVAATLAAAPKMTARNEAKVRQFYRRQSSPEFRQVSNDLAHWRLEADVLDRSIPTTMVAKESDTPRETFILARGEYDKKGEKVQPHLPSIFPPIPAGFATNRLGLAKWLLDPAHPLTARVTVNRLWQQYFGVGLVKTAEDFGIQGEHPSNPELLDWLATEFIRSGWDVKHMHRLLVNSATYRQSSRASPELISRDPENRLLARGPRFRLDAETVRDTALLLGGLLTEKIGGRSVRPFEPPGLWEAVSFNNSQRYVQDSGEAQYRRSLYTFWKRQIPPPTMLLFDAPSRESCQVRRSRSNTPLQALALLNDPQFVEASRAFAQRILAEGGESVDARVTFAFRSATARRPQPEELGVIRNLLQQELETFRNDRASAEKLLAAGGFPKRSGLDDVELAAWTTIASLILNLDETITKG